MSELRLEPVARVTGMLQVPGDKSISHRALILAAIARGRSYVGNCSPAADVRHTLECLRACGAELRSGPGGRIGGDGAGPGRSLRSPAVSLDCGNSGTTMRLLAGVLAGHDLHAELDGDASLRRRPMERVAAPLRRMGASVTTANGTAPLMVRGRLALEGGHHRLEVASAQLKSAVLLAGLSATAPVSVEEPAVSRDHTERLLRGCGLRVTLSGTTVTMVPGTLEPFGLRVPNDLSSAAFGLCLAAARPGSELRCPGVTLNPGRTGVLEVLRSMGAGLDIEEGEPAGGVEPCGDVAVRGGALTATRIAGDLIPRCIDELPVLAVLATQCEGITEIRDAAELRIKESDRLGLIIAGLRALGATVTGLDDGMVISGPTRLRGCALDAAGDHRLAMAWTVAAALAEGHSALAGAAAVAVSYPTFFEDLAAVAAG